MTWHATISLTLGIDWADAKPTGAPLGPSDVVILRKVSETGSQVVYTEDGTNTPSLTNRLKYTCSNDVSGWHTDTWDIFDGASSWLNLGSAQLTDDSGVEPPLTWDFKVVWGETDPVWYIYDEWFGGEDDAFVSGPGPYNDDIIETMEVGPIEAEIAAAAPAATSAVTATAGRAASISASAPAATSGVSATAGRVASIAGAAAEATASITAKLNLRSASIDATAPEATSSITAEAQRDATISGGATAATSAISATAGRTASISGAAPAATSSITADVGRILRWVDFEPPEFGEFPAGVSGGGGNVVLSQDDAEGLPERGTTALVVTMTAGAGGEQYLQIDLGAAQAAVSVGAYLSPGSASGGAVVILAGYDAASAETWRIEFDADALTITTTLATTDTLTGALPGGSDITWQHVELHVTAGEARLFIGGIEADSVADDFTTLATRYVRIGCISKDNAATGELLLDECIVATKYWGPMRIRGEVDRLCAERLLLIYNTTEAESREHAQWYRDQHSLPYANLVGLPLSGGESIDQATFESSLRDPLVEFIAQNRMTHEIAGLLLGYRTPGLITPGTTVQQALRAPGSQTADEANPDYLSGVVDVDDLPERSTLYAPGRYLVMEVPQQSLAMAQAATTRGAALVTTDLVDREFAALAPGTDKLGAATSAPGVWSEFDDFDETLQMQQIRLPRNEDFDGSEHGDALELTDADGGAFIVGQQLALLVSVGDQSADTMR